MASSISWSFGVRISLFLIKEISYVCLNLLSVLQLCVLLIKEQLIFNNI